MDMKRGLFCRFALISFIILSQHILAQAQEDQHKKSMDSLRDLVTAYGHRFDILEKMIDDLLWFQKVGDVAFVDKVYITGPPPAREKSKTAQGFGNPLKFYSYVFIPRDIDHSRKYPLLVLPHGGVHGNFETYYAHIIRELMAQQYIVIAPEYRGSTGYGQGFYQRIDYGGLENEDVLASRDFMIENYGFIDDKRVGIIGWSHGGMIALMNIFEYPDKYQVAFAGVPVSDLIARMGYKTDAYRKLFSADYHLGKTAYEDVAEYRRRSPAWQAHKLQTPLLIHTNTNDDDVNVLEVEHLIKSLQAEKKNFEHEIFHNIEGGHSFDRIDTRKAKEIRLKVYAFLAKHLQPPRPIKNKTDLERAAYPGSHPSK